jgi:phosphoglycerate dehydrogenase-like enzyme
VSTFRTATVGRAMAEWQYQRRIALLPSHMRPDLALAIKKGGASIADTPAAADGVVWVDPERPQDLWDLLRSAPNIRWVQVTGAGIDQYLPFVSADRIWTSAKGAYADSTAEHALALLLAGVRHLHLSGASGTWSQPSGRIVKGSQITIFGGGGIGTRLAELLAPFEPQLTIVRRSGVIRNGVPRAFVSDEIGELVTGADFVVLALPLTGETRGMINAESLERMSPKTWLINVARGAHIVTADLVRALKEGVIAGAALDVTDPEPLPQNHELWDLSNCLITPHSANPPELAAPMFAMRVEENVRRFCKGEPLLGVVRAELGY